MTAFSAIEKTAKRTPGRTLLLYPEHFADEWERKPREPVCVGLRLMSESDKNKARAESEKLALELHPRGGPNAIDAFNDALVRQTAALGICDPNSVDKPHALMPLAEYDVRQALTSSGARYIFEAILRYEVEVSPLFAEATDDEMAEIRERLSKELALERLPPARRGVVRRYLRFVLEALRDD